MLESIQKIKLGKLENIRKVVNPYPEKVERTYTCQEVVDSFDVLEKAKKEVVLAGRIRAIRSHGGSAFLNIEDGSATIQVFLRKDEVGEEEYKFFDNFDIGDFIEIKGVMFNTKKGEKTLLAKSFRMLSKSLLPLPSEWYGVQDKEIRFRKRYLDLLMNPEVKEKFKVRSKVVKLLREFLDEKGYMEVETPILQTIPGGALAKPFKTKLNALDLDLYLRVAPELYLKRLLVGGFEKVYEIGRCFRNEGMDFSHNPDFTMLEFYAAYQDKDYLLKLTEELFSYLVKNIFGKLEIEYEGKKISFKTPFKKVNFADLAKTDEEAKEVFKGFVNPTFVIGHPRAMSPLAKTSEKNPKEAARFQLIINGLEIVNAYSELNDPIDQKKRFLAQQDLREKGNEEALRYDEDFIEALEYGMPPAAGWGMGIDRLVALLTDSHTLREIILFPTMKPKE